MNITKPFGGEGPSVILSLPVLRLQTKRDQSGRGAERLADVADEAARTANDFDGARLVVSAGHLAREKYLELKILMGARAFGCDFSPEEAVAFDLSASVYGTDHPDAERLIGRLASLKCKPYADEIACGLASIMHWITYHPVKIARICGLRGVR